VPWSFRRSKKVGPFRFTLSRRGLGVSGGSKRVRVGRSATGRRGVSVALPFGLRWFKSLGNRGR
jgi:hypothetical protein